MVLCVSLAARGEEFDAQEVLLAAEYGLSRMRDLVQHQEPGLYDKGEDPGTVECSVLGG